jgi:hypothetical protein
MIHPKIAICQSFELFAKTTGICFPTKTHANNDSQIPLSENFWPLTSCWEASSARGILPVSFAVDALVPYRSRINRCIRYELKTSPVDVVLHGFLGLFVPHIAPVCMFVLGAACFLLAAENAWRMPVGLCPAQPNSPLEAALSSPRSISSLNGNFVPRHWHRYECDV